MLLSKLPLHNPLPTWQLPARKSEQWRHSPIADELQNKVFKPATPISAVPDSISADLPADANYLFWQNDNLPTSPTLTLTKHAQDDGSDKAFSPTPFTILNQASEQHRLELTIAQAHQKPLIFAYGCSESDDAKHLPLIQPHIHITLEAGAHLDFFELVCGGGMSNALLHFTLKEGATLNHYVTETLESDAIHIGHITAQCAASSHYRHDALWQQGKMIRRDAQIMLDGTDARTDFYAMGKIAGETHLDHNTHIVHHTPHTYAQEEIRTLIDGQASNNFQGKISVCQDAQQTESYQMSRALMLCKDAQCNHKPELEIYADDVKCSHGSTIGAPDLEQIFYLRSRGFSHEQALILQMEGFLGEMIQALKNPDAQKLFWQRAFPAS